MFHKVRMSLLILLVSGIILFTGVKTFIYFTHSDLPEISLKGIQRDSYYSNELNAELLIDNSYKIDSASFYLDDKKLDVAGTKNINKRKIKIPFYIDTKELSNGKHILTVELVDSSYNKNKNIEKFDFYVDNKPLKTGLLDEDYKVLQGRTIHAKIQSNKRLENASVNFLEHTYNFYPESENSKTYECFIPVDCEQKPDEYILEIQLQDFVKNKAELLGKVTIKNAVFPKQKGFFIDPGKLDEEKEISMNSNILKEALIHWLEDSPKKKLWDGQFINPIDIKRVSTPFGEIRTTPQRGRYLHKAVDILNYPKSVVWASQDGRIIIKDRFLFSGNTVVIDHGIGVFSLYYHLEDFADIEVGDMIKKGNPLGRLGMTGYANGYHLHWELRVNNIQVDPFQWTNKSF